MRRSNHVQQLQLQQIEQQRTIRAKQLEIARLRDPQLVQERAKRLDEPLVPPCEASSLLPPDELWLAEP